MWHPGSEKTGTPRIPAQRSRRSLLEYGTCRGIVTADVLELGLSRGAIATRKLEEVIVGQGTRGFILVRPLTVKVKAYVQFEVVLIRVTITRELNSYARLSMRLLSSLNRCRVVPLYREADAQQPLESRPAHKSVWLGLSTILALHYKFYHNNDCNYRP